MTDQLQRRLAMFIAFWFSALVLLYAGAPIFYRDPYFQQTFLGFSSLNPSVAYFQFINFWFWLVLTPAWIFLIAGSTLSMRRKGKGGLHR